MRIRALAALFAALIPMAGCTISDGPPQFGPGTGTTYQARLVSAAGLDVGKAAGYAQDATFEDGRDIGLAASSVLADGLTGAAGGAVTLMAGSPSIRENLVIPLVETRPGTDTHALEAEIARAAAPLIGRPSESMVAVLTGPGDANGKNVWILGIGSRAERWSNTGRETIPVYRALADRFPGTISVYIPPLRGPHGWSRPTLYKGGRSLPL